MPYIKKSSRNKIRHVIGQDASGASNFLVNVAAITTPGELNYAFSIIAADYVKRNGLNYQNINDVKGALQGALAEFDRRVTSPYEDQKIAENGDVYNE